MPAIVRKPQTAKAPYMMMEESSYQSMNRNINHNLDQYTTGKILESYVSGGGGGNTGARAPA